MRRVQERSLHHLIPFSLPTPQKSNYSCKLFESFMVKIMWAKIGHCSWCSPLISGLVYARRWKDMYKDTGFAKCQRGLPQTLDCICLYLSLLSFGQILAQTLCWGCLVHREVMIRFILWLIISLRWCTLFLARKLLMLLILHN